MYEFTAEDFQDNGMAYEIFAQREMIREQRPMPGVNGENGWYDVTSSFFKLDGAVGYAVCFYCDNNGFEGATFEKLYAVPACEIKRGPMPKSQIKIDGIRYWNPIH